MRGFGHERTVPDERVMASGRSREVVGADQGIGAHRGGIPPRGVRESP
jgi:hypothetical protein